MKAITEINKKKVPEFYINPELNKYDNIVLFPEKLARAKENIKNTNLIEFLKKLDESEKAGADK